MSDELLTADQVADILHISVHQVKRRTAADNWPCVKFSGKTIRYTTANVDAIVARYASTSNASAGLEGQTAGSKARAS